MVVKVGPNANLVESISGKMGAFVRTFGDNRHPVVPVEEQKLEDLLGKSQKARPKDLQRNCDDKSRACCESHERRPS